MAHHTRLEVAGRKETDEKKGRRAEGRCNLRLEPARRVRVMEEDAKCKTGVQSDSNVWA